MDIREIKTLIAEGEGFELEFKRKVSSPEKIAKTISAFANTQGGIILFGVDDDGSIIGVESEKSELDLIHEAGTRYCDPPVDLEIDIVPHNKKDVIAVSIDQSDQKPHYVVHDHSDEARAFVRVKDNSVLASREVVKVLRDQRLDTPLTVSIGENEKRLFSYFEENDRITVREYSELINVSYRRASRILTTLVRAGVIRIHTLERTDYFTLASGDEVSAQNHKEPHRRRRQR